MTKHTKNHSKIVVRPPKSDKKHEKVVNFPPFNWETAPGAAFWTGGRGNTLTSLFGSVGESGLCGVGFDEKVVIFSDFLMIFRGRAISLVLLGKSEKS